MLDDETTDPEMQIELLILKSKITFRLGFFGENIIGRSDEALTLINQVIEKEEIQNNQWYILQASALKAEILGHLNRWDEFLIEIENVENILQNIENLDIYQQKFAQAKFVQLKGHIPLANTCTEDVDWDLETSLNSLNEALSIFRDLNQHEEIVDVIYDIVNNLRASSQITEIFTYTNEGLRVAEQSGNHYLIAHSLLLLGIVHYTMNDYKNTFYFAKRSLEVYEKVGDRGGILSAKNMIGLYYLKIESLEEAKKVFQEMIDEAPESLAALVNLSMVYDKEGRLTEALDLLNRTNKLYQNEKNKYYLQFPTFHISRIKIMQGELDEALIFLKQFLTSSQARKFKVGVSYVLSLISSIYWQKGLNREAIEYATNAVKIIQETESKVRIAFRLFSLTKLLLEDSQFEEANAFFAQFKKLSDELNYKHINQRRFFIEALFLKSSENVRDVLKAEFAFEQLLKEDLSYVVQTQVLLNLCELNVLSLENNYDENLLDKIRDNIDLLQELATKTQSFSFIVQTLLLQAKIALIDLDVSKAKKLMSEALIIAEEKGLKSLELVVLEEKEVLAKQSINLEKVQLNQIEIVKKKEIGKLNESLNILKRDCFVELKRTETVESTSFQFKQNI